MLTLGHGAVVMRVDPDRGGRVASLEIDGLELLVRQGPDPMTWGCFPMVPWAGRVRHGRFVFEGRERVLPINLAPHAIHGIGFTRPWRVVDDATIALGLDGPWPFAGEVRQRFELTDEQLSITMTLRADETMPLTMGWHPWFRRDLGRGRPARLSFEADAMYRRGADGVPTGELVAVPDGPWDDCFTQLGASPQLVWPDALTLRVDHDCSHLVVYDEPADALCIEPQTGPPDGFNLEPDIIGAHETRTATMTLRWKL